MKVLSDASPLISLAEIGCLEVLRRLYSQVTITPEVYREVVIAGEGLAGAALVATASWIEVTETRSSIAQRGTNRTLGRGELSIIALAKEIRADIILIDDFAARRFANQEGLIVLGYVGVLESAFRKGFIDDLTQTYRKLIVSAAYISEKILAASLDRLRLPPL